jgi:hypothetical protein
VDAAVDESLVPDLDERGRELAALTVALWNRRPTTPVLDASDLPPDVRWSDEPVEPGITVSSDGEGLQVRGLVIQRVFAGYRLETVDLFVERDGLVLGTEHVGGQVRRLE